GTGIGGNTDLPETLCRFLVAPTATSDCKTVFGLIKLSVYGVAEAPPATCPPTAPLPPTPPLRGWSGIPAHYCRAVGVVGPVRPGLTRRPASRRASPAH